MNATLTTERLTLQSMTPAMIHELFKTRDKESIKRFFGGDDMEYELYRDMHEKGMETNRLSLFFFRVMLQGNDVPIGVCGFHTWNRSHRRGEIFYSLNNDTYKQKGYMTEALRAVLEFGFSGLGLHRVEAFVGAENIPSVKLLLRYGFIKEGTARAHYNVNGINEDSETYSLIKTDWEALGKWRMDN